MVFDKLILRNLFDRISNLNLNDGKAMLADFPDMHTELNRLSHFLLPSKVKPYGIADFLHSWIASYLTF